MLELDHVYCFVDPAGDWAARVAARGWRLVVLGGEPLELGPELTLG